MKLSAICLFTCFFFAFAGCDNDIALNTMNVEGIWREEMYDEEFDRISRLEYTFKEAGVLQILRIEVDKDSGEFLGYRHKATGNYLLSGNKLSFYNVTRYSNDDSKTTYSELEDLIKASEGESFDVTFEIQDDGKRLTFFYTPCDDSGMCLGTQTFIKAM